MEPREAGVPVLRARIPFFPMQDLIFTAGLGITLNFYCVLPLVLAFLAHKIQKISSKDGPLVYNFNVIVD